MRIQIFFIAILIHSSACVRAQSPLRVLSANSVRAKIVEGDDEIYGWRINPKLPLDIHILSKSVGAKRARFYTDKDSLDIKLLPGQSYDFTMLLYGRDSCHTRLENLPFHNYAADPEKHDTLGFTLTPYSNIGFRAVVNDKDTIWLAFDSGSTGLLLTDSTIRSLNGNVNLDSTANSLSLGALMWQRISAYQVMRTPHGMGGVFGWDFFDGRVVEIDYEKKQFIVHSMLRHIPKGYIEFPIEYKHGLICIHAALKTNRKTYCGRFLYDDGYERTVLLDTLLLAQQKVAHNFPILKRTILHNDHNKEIPVFTVLLEGLQFGNFILDSVPAQLLAAGNPAGFATHILGAEVLKRFNTIMDFQHNKIYLKPNSLSGLQYSEGKLNSR